MDNINKLAKLRKKMKENNIDGLIVAKKENRRYLSGFTGTAGALLITDQDNLLITDFRYVNQAGQQSPDFSLVTISKNLTQTLVEQIETLSLNNIGYEEDFWTCSDYQALTEKLNEKLASNNKIELVSASQLIKDLRIIKDEHELALIQKAVTLTDQAFAHILKMVKPGISELEVAIELEFYMRRLGASGPSFDYIVASGKRGSLPHGVATEKRIEPGELVTIDFGCVYQGYYSDMTRNFIFGQPDKKQSEIYQLVLTAQETALQKLQVGMSCQEVDSLARDVINKANYGQYFGHGLGHGVGLNIHEAPTLSPIGTGALEEGMIITIEPGIYIADWGGVRIEDMVLVKQDSSTILTKTSKQLYIL